MDIIIRQAEEADAGAIAAIYRHHVLNGTASFDLEAPSLGDTLVKIRHIKSKKWPFLVAEIGGELVGYAYVTQFRDRAAYRDAAENSIYVDARRRRTGIGRKLLHALVDASARRGFRTINAVIGGAEPSSIGLHQALGFSEVGRLSRVGLKFERWLDSVYMQRDLVERSH